MIYRRPTPFSPLLPVFLYHLPVVAPSLPPYRPLLLLLLPFTLPRKPQALDRLRHITVLPRLRA